jgi:hypothetical protein
MGQSSVISHQLSVNLEFTHFVVDRTGLTFASARDTASNRIYNFIVSQSGDIREQCADRFEVITGEWAEFIRLRIEHYRGIAPIYRIPHFDFN